IVRMRAQTLVFAVTVPETTSVSKPLMELRRATVFEAPLIVTVLVPAVKVDPAPLVFQLPVAVHVPVVSVIVPDEPLVIVTLPTETVLAFAVRMPALPTTNDPMFTERLAVASSVVPDVSLIVRVPEAFSPCVLSVNVLAATLEDWKAML